MRDPNRAPDPDEEFFVGYLPTPPGLTRFALGVAAVILVVFGGVAAGAALLERAPGAAHQRPAEITGRLIAAPYGMVRYEDEGRIRHVLLVRGGKFGAPARDVTRLDGRAVTVQGLALERDGRELLELRAAIAEAALDDDARARLDAVPTEDLGDVTVDGEIVDSKCYYGRMRPGGGRTHRACAQVCIAGNIPPVLVTHDRAGRATHYLLASRDGTSVAREVLPFVAEPVRVSGRLSRVADLLVLRIDPSTIARR